MRSSMVSRDMIQMADWINWLHIVAALSVSLLNSRCAVVVSKTVTNCHGAAALARQISARPNPSRHRVRIENAFRLRLTLIIFQGTQKQTAKFQQDRSTRYNAVVKRNCPVTFTFAERFNVVNKPVLLLILNSSQSGSRDCFVAKTKTDYFSRAAVA